MSDVAERIAKWNEGDGKPMKGKLIDWQAYEADPDSLNCMCAQGQLLHTVAGWSPQQLRDIKFQSVADKAVAELLNISRAHAILLRNINDKVDGAPSIVLTDPAKVLGSEWSRLLDFWWAFDQFDADSWRQVDAAGDAARDAARAAARDAAGDAAWVAAWDAAGGAAWDAAGAAARDAAGVAARAAARDAAGVAARAAAWDAAGDAAWVAAWAAARVAARAAARDAAGDAAWVAAWEIQGYSVLTSRGHNVFFLPMFGWKLPTDIPPRPADYGNGLVPVQ